MRVSSQDGVSPYRATRNLIDCSSNKPPASPMKIILSLLGMSILWIVNALAVPSSASVATSKERQHRALTCHYMLVSLPGGKLIPGRELAHPTANVLCSSRMLETLEACRQACAA